MVFGFHALRCLPVWHYVLHIWLFGAVLTLAQCCLSVCGIALPNGDPVWLILALFASLAAGVMTQQIDRWLRVWKRARVPAILHD